MIKTYVLAVYSILIFLFGWLVDPVEITMQAPTEIVAGLPFEVSVTIDKGALDGFARFQQKLPTGFSAELIDAEASIYSFERQTVGFFWLIVPQKEVIVLRYTITTDQNISGTYSIDGIFSYIDGEKKYIEMPLHEITITPSPLAQNVQDTAKVEMDALAQISCKRKSVNINEDGEIVIEIIVNRGDLTVDQFAKIQETVPKGYDAKSIETKGGIFTFQNNIAKFLWMTLPGEQEYIVAYKLIPEENTNLAKIEIAGNFSYLVNGQTIEVPLEETDKTVAQIVGEQLAYRQGDLKTKEDTVAIAENINNTDLENSDIDTETGAEGVVVAANTEVDNEEDSTEDSQITADNNTKNITVVEVPDTEVSYRVQIAAGHSRIQPVKYFAKLKVKEKINTEMLDGWYKYTVGGFGEYVLARNKRNTIWNKTPIKDAFVTAYNSGQRITVQEALMISNQTWQQ